MSDTNSAPTSVDMFTPEALAQSRQAAVSHVFFCLQLSASGTALFFAGGALATFDVALAGFLVAAAGAVVFGAGALRIGLASRHLLRYGDMRSTLPALSFAGFGASAAVSAASSVLWWLRVIDLPTSFQIGNATEFAMLSFGVLILLQTMLFVVRWLLSHTEDPLLLA